MNLPEKGYKRDFVIFTYFLIVLTVLAVSGGVIVKLLLPFVAAWLVALLLQPMIERAVKKTRWSVKSAGILVFSLILILTSAILFLVFRRLYNELRSLNIYIAENYENIASKAVGLIRSVLDRFRRSDTPDGGYIYDMMTETVRSSLSDLTFRITDAVGDFLASLPYFFFALIIFIMAAFYFCADFDGINRAILSVVPSRIAPSWRALRTKVLTSALKYIRAYVILFLITFVALLVGFALMGERYATLLAALVALLDILPVIGVGTVLIPWIIVLFILGQVKKGIILTVVCLVVMIGRQALEPYVVGTQLGVHPLLTLVSVFAGYKIFGILGFIIGPIAIVIIKNLFELFFAKLVLRDEKSAKKTGG